jgi:UDP-N-acetylglucosamine diphosphorylase / glucose-1-phosphate thymidylyltransferase / UDP-N-acetylgalactosamine diphosphorylase / glucosamine-1-phosphate N-acetyltransferase / galactosamine-1-phosphate N-acetyltransferase
MKLVIMAAGEWSRMRPLTETIPKPLLKVCGKTIIEENIENIMSEFDEIFMIVKYKKEKFREYFWDKYKWIPIQYIEQGVQNGTWAAILSLKDTIHGEFIVVSGDDLYEGSDILKLAHTSGFAALAKQVEKPENFGIFEQDTHGNIRGIVEKPTDTSLGNLAYIGVLKLDDTIFTELDSLPLSPRWELEITDLMKIHIEQQEFTVVEATGRWITIGYPWDLLKAHDILIWCYTETINKWAIIEPNVIIKWHVYLEEGVVLKSGTYIEWNVFFWKNCEVGPYTHIRGNTYFGQDSRGGSFSEIKGCYFGDNTVVAQNAVIVDTIAGNDVNFASGVITTNLRHDNKNIRVLIKDTLVDTGRRKLGTIVGDHARFGANTTIYPGRSIPSHGTTLPWDVIR